MKPAREQPGVQRDMVRLRETKDDMLCLYAPGSPKRRSYRAVLEVSPINLSLKAEDEQEAIIERFARALEIETAEAVADIEEDASAAGLAHACLHLARGIENAERVVIVAVRDDVAGPHQIHDLVGLGRREADVRHERQLVFIAKLTRDLEEVEAVAAVHVGPDLKLHAEDHIAVGDGGLAGPAHL